MRALDVSVMVVAMRRESSLHPSVRAWMEAAVLEPFGVTDLALSAVLRILTQPVVRLVAAPKEGVIEFLDALRSEPMFRPLPPGPRHWDIFVSLCRLPGVQGKLVADAYHAATAIEHGCDWVTLDRDFERFPGLRVRYPDV